MIGSIESDVSKVRLGSVNCWLCDNKSAYVCVHSRFSLSYSTYLGSCSYQGSLNGAGNNSPAVSSANRWIFKHLLRHRLLMSPTIAPNWTERARTWVKREIHVSSFSISHSSLIPLMCRFHSSTIEDQDAKASRPSTRREEGGTNRD